MEVSQVRDARDGIAEEIRRRGFKQAAIAKMAGLTEQQLSDIINKRRKMDANEMFQLCNAMGASMEAMFRPSGDDAGQQESA